MIRTILPRFVVATSSTSTAIGSSITRLSFSSGINSNNGGGGGNSIGGSNNGIVRIIPEVEDAIACGR